MVRSVLGYGEIDVELVGAHGWPGLSPTLGLDTDVLALGFRPGASCLLLGQASAWFARSNVVVGSTVVMPYTLAYKPTQQYLDHPSMPTPRRVQLRLPIDAAALMSFEGLRDGGDFRLQLDVTVVLVSDGYADPRQPDPPGMRSTASLQRDVPIQTSLQVSQDDWNRVLTAWNRGVAIPLGVPIPEIIPGAERIKIVSQLRDACARMNDGDAKGSINASREAVELLRTMCDNGSPQPSDPKRRTVAQRRRALAQALFDLASAASHADPVIRDEAWSRRDAMLVLAGAAALADRVFN